MFIADFHIHSKYSRATSRDCVPEWLDFWARQKGLDLIGTGDFTHPAWRGELREKLAPAGDGLYALKDEFVRQGVPSGVRPPRFVVTGEISSIYKKGGRVRKVHNLILLPGIDEAEALARRLEAIGNLHSDGRPILGLDSRDLLEITLDACPDAVFIPAHIWTPHFSLFGANSGFDTIEECFGDMARHIHALETGLSSNPAMNWRLSALDGFALVSNSDAHSPGKLAREANLFDTVLSYPHVARALDGRDADAFKGTLEFFPEEGKYHFDGHRACKLCLDPADTPADGRCPVCGGKLTIGVLHRVEQLADRDEGFAPLHARRFESLVPLPEVLAASTGWSPTSKKGTALYAHLLKELGPELTVLREAPVDDIEAAAGAAVAEGVRRLRAGEVRVAPGYDGEYGKVSILTPDEWQTLGGQMRLFEEEPRAAAPPKPRKKQISMKYGTEASSTAPGAAQDDARREPVAPDALESLNEEQRAAACATAPVVAVIAGPGTGKTKTLVARIVHLLRQRGLRPAQITAVTFTRKAAAELRERLAKQLGGSRAVRGLNVGTFHALCLAQLRRAGQSPVVIDGGAAQVLADELVREQGLKISARDALREISLRKCGAAWDAAKLPDGLYEAYCARLAAAGVMDYDDILLRALEAAEAGAEAAPACFTQLLVDEFQDTNPLQYRLVRAWARHSAGLFVIGDPNQAIYGFRGADAACFSQLRGDAPGLAETVLTRNYRSTGLILDCARPVLPAGAQAPALVAQRGHGQKVRLVRADTPFAEAVFVAKEIGAMVGGIDMLSGSAARGGSTRAFSDIAVLYRTNRQAALFEECLAKEGIPYVVSGRDGFLSQPETVRLLAFFRLLQNPADRFSLRLCLRELAGCPAAQCNALAARHEEGEQSIAALLALLRAEPACGGMPLFAQMLEEHGPEGPLSKGKPQKLLAAWVAGQGLAGTPWAEHLLHTAAFHGSMEDFLAAVTLGQEGDIQRYGGKTYNPDAVSLMTLHAAKGLEFPAVFLCGLAAGTMPGGRRRGPEDEAEERRLLYVGMTRAKDELVLVHAGEPSPFLAALPPDLLETGEARPQREAPGCEQIRLF